MQRICTAILCTVFCLLFVTPQAAADVLEDILDRRVIRIGVAEFVPWTMRSKSGELIGFEIDVARKLAADMGVRADIRVYELNDIIPAVQQGEIDVIAGGLAITPRRALQVSFSRPLASTGISVAVNGEKLRNVSSLEHLDDERVVIAAVSDTLALNVSQTFFPDAEIRVFETAAEAETELLENRAHAYLASEPEVDFLAMQSGGRIEVPIAEPMMASAEGLAVRRGEQELLNFLDAWVVARQTDKWLVAARNYWFKSIDWAAELAE
ncbi:MAG: transporter substrate-binding domain-containing protein [Woeseiaceae bacterium]|nr:transporter substrate-binding domain-containing protein [Woeseiaceae bacterium]